MARDKQINKLNGKIGYRYETDSHCVSTFTFSDPSVGIRVLIVDEVERAVEPLRRERESLKEMIEKLKAEKEKQDKKIEELKDEIREAKAGHKLEKVKCELAELVVAS